MRILFLGHSEPSQSSYRNIFNFLKAAGEHIDEESSLENAHDLLQAYEYTVCVMHDSLFDSSGLEFSHRLRQESLLTPLVGVSNSRDASHRIKLLEEGVDDVLTYPFDNRELLARLHAVVRRSNGHAQSVIQVGRLCMDLERGMVTVDNKIVPLTGKEFTLLELLCLRRGRILTKEVMLNYLYGGMDEPELKIIDVFVCKIRKKIMKVTGGVDYIHTIWGRGYSIYDDAEAQRTQVG